MSFVGTREVSKESGARLKYGSRAPFAIVVAVLVAAGSLTLYPLWASAWRLWSSDPLRSIGIFFPFISLIGTLAAWQQIRWRLDGSYWGLPVILISVVAARVFDASTAGVLVEGHSLGLLHPGIALFFYGVGVVLLFGGPKLLRQALFPLCLLLLINPVPRFFNTLLDLPLQELSANTARAFAHGIGLRPTGAQLRMMFAPDFGMMIVPGCNGIRGSVTFGYLALLFGYYRGLSKRALTLFTLGAVLLGYTLNLVRLCVLVIYYRIGLSVPSIQKFGAQVDYGIGITLFLIATLGLGVVIRRFAIRYGRPQEWRVAEMEVPLPAAGISLSGRVLGFASVVLVFLIPQLKAIAAGKHAPPTEAQVLLALPHIVGPYTLDRSWAEHDTNGGISMLMSDYIDRSSGDRLTFGLWLANNNHFVAGSKQVQGVRPQSTGSFDTVAQHSLPVHFVTNFYDNGVNLSYDAETACTTSGCEEHLAGASQTMQFLAPRIADLIIAPTSKRLPILLRREWAGTDTPHSEIRTEFESSAREFMNSLDVQKLLELGA